MKFLELHLKGFGKFHDRTISFTDGINVIYGKNEPVNLPCTPSSGDALRYPASTWQSIEK
ncbi:MAG: ATP-binding protein [Gallintestinimicrobium sp.]